MSSEASETHWSQWTHVLPMQVSKILPKLARGQIPFSGIFIPDLVLSWWRGQSLVAPKTKVTELWPGTYAASVSGLFLDLSAPDLAPGFSVRWVKPQHSCWGGNCCILLPGAVHRGHGILWCHQPCHMHMNKVHCCSNMPPPLDG